MVANHWLKVYLLIVCFLFVNCYNVAYLYSDFDVC